LSSVLGRNPHETEVVGNALAGRWMVVQCSVPRRWWFWVPPGTKSFTARTQWIQNYQSQREDWGITIFSPRGQRVRTLWGDLDMDRGRPFNTPQSRTASAIVNVEPGAAGRFWCAGPVVAHLGAVVRSRPSRTGPGTGALIPGGLIALDRTGR